MALKIKDKKLYLTKLYFKQLNYRGLLCIKDPDLDMVFSKIRIRVTLKDRIRIRNTVKNTSFRYVKKAPNFFFESLQKAEWGSLKGL